MNKLTLSTAAFILLSVAPPSLAGTYYALCPPYDECFVTIADDAIITPQERIPTERILSWSLGGNGSTTDVGLGIGLTVLFGVPGLLGFFAQNHDYQYSINYLNPDGKTNTAVIAFANDVPAKQFQQELTGATGLTVGMQNTKIKNSIENSNNGTNKYTVPVNLEFADESDLFFRDSPNPNFRIGLQDWVLFQNNFYGYDFKYSPKDTIDGKRFVNVQVLQQRITDPSFYFVQTIRIDCQRLSSSFYIVEAPLEYKQYSNRWFKPVALLPESPGSNLAKRYCKKSSL
jgi:hypothetical protein